MNEELLSLRKADAMTIHDEARALQERLRKMPRCGPWQEDGTMAPMLVNPDGPEAADLLQSLSAERERLRSALERMVYETTHLSPLEDDGSHWCKISREALEQSRAALNQPKESGND